MCAKKSMCIGEENVIERTRTLVGLMITKRSLTWQVTINLSWFLAKYGQQHVFYSEIGGVLFNLYFTHDESIVFKIYTSIIVCFIVD